MNQNDRGGGQGGYGKNNYGGGNKPRGDFRGGQGGYGKSSHGGQGGGRNNGFGGRQAQEEIKAEPLPADFADKAEAVMQQNARNISTSKLRRLLSLLIPLYNEENLRDEDELSAESRAQLQLIRIRILYEAGRDPEVMKFIRFARLVHYLKWLEASAAGTRRKLLDYFHYMEALVAYHKFYGGREN